MAKGQKTNSGLITLFASLLLVGGAVTWIFVKGPRDADPSAKVLAKEGVHWHADLSITIKGEKQAIPADVGTGGAAAHPENLHTHDDSGTIHAEFPGVVRANELKIGKFFEIWGKTFDANCIFDKCTGAEGTLKFLVNGQPNTDYGEYSTRDGDKLEIVFE